SRCFSVVDTAPPALFPLSLHDALPICAAHDPGLLDALSRRDAAGGRLVALPLEEAGVADRRRAPDRTALPGRVLLPHPDRLRPAPPRPLRSRPPPPRCPSGPCPFPPGPVPDHPHFLGGIP